MRCETHCPGSGGSGLGTFIGAAVAVLAAGAAVSAVLRAVAPLIPAIIGGEALAALGMVTLAVLRLAPGRGRARGLARAEPRSLPGYRAAVIPAARGSERPAARIPARQSRPALAAPERPAQPQRGRVVRERARLPRVR